MQNRIVVKYCHLPSFQAVCYIPVISACVWLCIRSSVRFFPKHQRGAGRCSLSHLFYCVLRPYLCSCHVTWSLLVLISCAIYVWLVLLFLVSHCLCSYICHIDVNVVIIALTLLLLCAVRCCVCNVCHACYVC